MLLQRTPAPQASGLGIGPDSHPRPLQILRSHHALGGVIPDAAVVERAQADHREQAQRLFKIQGLEEGPHSQLTHVIGLVLYLVVKGLVGKFKTL